MKKYLLTLFVMVAALSCRAGDDLITVNAGYLYKNALDLTIGYEHPLPYGQAIEVFGEAGNKWHHPTCCQFWKGYWWGGGAVYKYRLKRMKNSLFKVYGGPVLGSVERKFFLGIEVGFEYSHVFRSGVQFCITQKNNFNFLHGDTFRNGLLIGFKFPI